MNEKYKWILLKGGLGFGPSFAFLYYFLQVHIRNNTVPFGSITALFVISILLGLVWGTAMYNMLGKQKS